MIFRRQLEQLSHRLTTGWQAARDGLCRPFLSSRNGNVTIIAAVSMIPLALAMGIGVDYAIQKRGQDQVSGIADATALIATTPAMMAKSASAAQAAAQSYFSTQSATVFNVTLNYPQSGNVVVNDVVNGTIRTRTVTVTWTGTSSTYLSSLVGLTTLGLGGTSQASASSAPNINFYLLVDTSPSMAFPTTTAGLNYMQSNTGCYFACHETNPSADGYSQDGYSVARANNVTLRIDLVNQAVQNLLNTAASDAKINLTTYGISISSINFVFTGVYSTGNIAYAPNSATGQTCAQQTPSAWSNLCAAQSAVANTGAMQLLEVLNENCLFSGNCSYDNGGSDQDSSLDSGISSLGTINTSQNYVSTNSCYIPNNTTNNYYAISNNSDTINVPKNPCSSTSTSNPTSGPGFQMYKPGNGTNAAGDSPQEVLFIITDGMVDSYMQNTNGVFSGYVQGNRILAPMNSAIDNCTSIKNQGIRIAVLYLTYNPLPANSFYVNHVQNVWPGGPTSTAPQADLASAAQACASPGLYTNVNTDGDINQALANLFQTAVATAHLTQ